MNAPDFLLLASQPPLRTDRPASGLAVRHALIARSLAEQGLRVRYGWQGSPLDDASTQPDWPGVECRAFANPQAFKNELRSDPPDVVVLGYWELATWLPDPLACPLVLDYVAPRWIERHMESPALEKQERGDWMALLARCDEVWVGNEVQADALQPWLLMAGHTLRDGSRTRVVPIANTVRVSEPPGRRPVRLLSGGQDWPWRQSERWLHQLEALPQATASVQRLGGEGVLADYSSYQRLVDEADVVVELADDNVERRLSHSFRMSDALCRGRPVLMNDFLPFAATVEAYGAGWAVSSPAEAQALVQQLSEAPERITQAASAAGRLAKARLDAAQVYGGLADGLRALIERGHQPAQSDSGGARRGWRTGLTAYGRGWVEHRLRRPVQRFWQWLASGRPRPDQQRETWVVLSRPDIFPVNHGAAVKIERTVWGLSHHVDEVLLLTDDRSGYRVYRQGEVHWQRFPLWLRMLGWPRKINILRVLARGLPLSNAFLYLPLVDRSLQWRLLWVLRRHPVSVVQGEFPAYAAPAVWAARLFGTRSLMVEHNVEFARIPEQVESVRPAETDALRDVEITLANACDRVITVSERDRLALIQHGVQPGRISTIPHGVDLQAFVESDAVDLRARYQIPSDHAVLAYHGIYSYEPNAEAVRELSRVILPALAARGCPASVVAMGPRPLTEALPGVVFAGAVDDLAGHLKGADLAVIPLRQGGGTRMKILDDFAAGLPVVTTAKGMEGIDVKHEEHLCVVDDAEAMADEIVGLLADGQRRERMAQRASEWVAAMDWRAIAGRYVRLMSPMPDVPPGGSPS